MQNKLKAALIQADLVWENATQNRFNFSEKISKITKEVDVIVLPEMFSTGFTMQPKNVAEKMNGETVKWMQKIASEKNTAICGSVVIEENNHYYNRFLFVHPNRKIEYYNKRHLFTLSGEHTVYDSGKEKVIIEYKGWKICLQICYDLRFPVFTRNIENYDLILYVANWPKPSILAWDSLLKARALENLAYVIGVNRVGADANNLAYNGHSAAYNCLGEKESISKNENEFIEIVTLDKKHILETRKKLNFLNDKDSFTIQYEK